jgi:signal peptidase I
MELLTGYRAWKNRQRGIKEARLLLREARRVLRKYAHRLTSEATVKVRQAIDGLAAVLTEKRWDDLSGALNTLDKRLDEHLSFARKSTAREYAESIAIAVLIALFLRAFVVEAFKIPSGSMIPTLQVGDHIFVNKFIYGVRLPFSDSVKFGMGYRKPRRGEVIVFIYPKEPDKDFIKRIVAVEGDTVEIRDDQLWINGKPVPREHIPGECRYEDYLEDTGQWVERRCEAWRETMDGKSYTTIYDRNGTPTSWSHVEKTPPLRGPYVVPPHSVFVMGDNRNNSHDSRYWGQVDYSLIKGKAMVIWWSYGEPEGARVHRLFHLVE